MEEYNNILVSIIVPIYNAEKYITYCLDSIQNQSYPNFEVILIDDGALTNAVKSVMIILKKIADLR